MSYLANFNLLLFIIRISSKQSHVASDSTLVLDHLLVKLTQTETMDADSQEHSKRDLRAAFPLVPVNHVDKVFSEHRNLFYPAYKALALEEHDYNDNAEKPYKRLAHKRKKPSKDSNLAHESAQAADEDTMKDYQVEQDAAIKTYFNFSGVWFPNLSGDIRSTR
jgi:hypothetical protein